MMSDGPEWFAPKRYGYGVGPADQLAGLGGHDRPSWRCPAWRLLLDAAPRQCPASASSPDRPLMVIRAKTTRGGWRWRWGERQI